MQEVEAICNRAIIINDGIIVADDNTISLSHTTLNKNILTVEFDKPFEKELILKIKGVKQIKKKNNNVWQIETEGDVDIRQDIFKFAVDHSISVLEMHKEEERLEKVFQQLTKK